MSHVRLVAPSAGTAFAAILASSGCVEPTVDTVVAWVESVDDGSGRDVQVYERGRRYAVRLVPDIAGSDLQIYGLAVDPRGRGVAQAGDRRLSYVGFEDSRQPVLTNALFGGAEPSARFAFTRSGDALLRAPGGVTAARYAFMPTSSAHAGEAVLLEPPDGLMTGQFELISAADAPVFVWVEYQGSPSRASGRVAAFAYPSDVNPEALQVDEVTALATGQVYAAALPLISDLQLGAGWCPHRTCVAPDGRGVIAPAGRCSFWSWRWADEPGPGGEVAPEQIVIEDGCPEEPRPSPSLYAALDVDLAVLDDGDRLYLADLSARRMTSAPKLWDNAGRARFGAGGRSLTLVSDDSRVVYVDADGPRVISGDSIPCAGPPSNPRVSPSGLWMARVCLGDGTFAPASQALIIRVSPLGVETFISVPMEVLGVDDGGNVLLNSQSDAREPRGLFVLDDDGGVTRIDALEPEPQEVRDGAGNNVFFAVQNFVP